MEIIAEEEPVHNLHHHLDDDGRVDNDGEDDDHVDYNICDHFVVLKPQNRVDPLDRRKKRLHERLHEGMKIRILRSLFLFIKKDATHTKKGGLPPTPCRNAPFL